MYAFIVPGPKQADLHRDGRYALHSFPCADNEDAFYCTGQAEAEEDPGLRQVLAEIFVTERAGVGVPDTRASAPPVPVQPGSVPAHQDDRPRRLRAAAHHLAGPGRVTLPPSSYPLLRGPVRRVSEQIHVITLMGPPSAAGRSRAGVRHWAGRQHAQHEGHSERRDAGPRRVPAPAASRGGRRSGRGRRPARLIATGQDRPATAPWHRACPVPAAGPADCPARPPAPPRTTGKPPHGRDGPAAGRRPWRGTAHRRQAGPAAASGEHPPPGERTVQRRPARRAARVRARTTR